MSHSTKSQPKIIRVLFENSLFLIAGAAFALVWANVDAASYGHFIHFDLRGLFVDIERPSHDDPHDDSQTKPEQGKDSAGETNPTAENPSTAGPDHDAKSADSSTGDALRDGADAEQADTSKSAGHDDAHAAHGFTIHFLINDVLMALFFAIAAKEVWESMLPGGALSNPRKAATPLMATLGGIVGPAGVYLAGAALTGRLHDLSSGWAIPCATDIAFSYLVARLIFGVGHPAIAFLLLLAIADDAAGLVILAIVYPSKPVVPQWLLLTLVAMAAAFALRKMRAHNFWWYLLIPGVMSWLSFYWAGLHPALGLVPIIPLMPSAHSDLGIFAREELNLHDTLNAFEHWWKNPVEIILGLFGLVNAGVEFNAVGVGTWLVLLGLIIGKPLGITLFTWISEKVFRLEVPAGMSYRHIFSLGMIAAIGFTVALFVSTAAFPLTRSTQAVQDSVKMGALMSLGAAVLAFLVARLLGVRPEPSEDEKEQQQPDSQPAS